MPDSDWIVEYLERADERGEKGKAKKMTGSIRPIEKPHIYFISYSQENQAEADHVEVLLRRMGREVWRDETQASTNEPIDDKVKHGIDRAETFVVLWSESYNSSSDWCMPELNRALQLTRQTKEKLVERVNAPQRIAFIRIDDSEPYWRMGTRLNLMGTTRDQRHLVVRNLVDTEMGRTPDKGGEESA